jgi:hypothetical protein
MDQMRAEQKPWRDKVMATVKDAIDREMRKH